MIAPVLADILRSRRDSLNARFAAARRRWPHLEPTDFTFFLRTQLSPLVAAVAESSPSHIDSVATLGYDLGLQLVAEKIAGPAAAGPTVNRLWSETLPALSPVVATSPRRVLGSLCNAAHQLTATPGTHPSAWLDQLSAVGPRCVDAGQLLLVAQLLAWRAGLAHYRESALAAGHQLPPALALAAVQAPAHSLWPEVIAAHLRDPWFGYDFTGSLLEPTPFPRRVGAFRGFGGFFPVPPTVSVNGEHFLVRSDTEGWLLIADAFGTVFHRASPAELTAPVTAAPLAPALAARLPAGHTVTSVALLPHSFALTTAESHAVWIGPLSSS